MREMSKVRLTVLLFAATVGIPLTSSADPIPVTSGSGFVLWDGSLTPGPTLTGPGLAVSWPFAHGSVTTGWTVGTMGNLNGSISYQSFNPEMMGGPFPITVSGVDYMVSALSGLLIFNTVPFLVEPPDSSNQRAFNTTFTMTGRITGRDSTGAMLFSVPLTGQGRAASTATNHIGNGFYTMSGAGSVTYEFDDPAATPEPASLLLMGTGLAGLALRRRMKRVPGDTA